jgi:hypothetical protein
MWWRVGENFIKSWILTHGAIQSFCKTLSKTFANTFQAFQLVQRLNTLIPCTFKLLNFHRSKNKCIEFISTDSLYIFIPASVTARTNHKKSFQNFTTGRLYTVEEKGGFSAYTAYTLAAAFYRNCKQCFFFLGGISWQNFELQKLERNSLFSFILIARKRFFWERKFLLISTQILVLVVFCQFFTNWCKHVTNSC